ncbi:MAG: zinc ribbon domain-containing protein [Bacteroidetes bacterium]|nr:zinc ribbon domain-containing protein [Bacteroidota bacterium]MBU1578378.1 zinc ribbon domain-containing protein [Bacteroidota bacterium]MBU2465520.1 zinc ribbon domain-containing protein [Bacteroidota bacterium]MBU2559158.1 zinc ribbon domain-containing protein [Bacteroidota bacterium]
MRTLKYHCPKCGSRQYEVGEIRVTGSLLAKIFDVQNKKFSSVTCSNCTYTEFYRVGSNNLANVFDLFVG